MKRQILLLVLFIVATTGNAQVFTEYFATAPIGGELESYNDWYVSAKSSEAYGVSPKIEEGALFYDGYAGTDIGNVAVLDSLIGKESATQRISTKMITINGDTISPIIGQKMYAAFMVQIFAESYSSYRDFFTWEGSTTSSFTRGRVFAKVSNEKKDLQFAVSKNSSSSGVYVESEVMEGAVGGIQLLVLTYEAVEGDANDVISLYINPDPTKTEADQTAVLVAVDEQSDYSETQDIKINLRQRAVSAYLGGIRVGRSWSEVVTGPATKISEIANTNTGIYSYGKTIVTRTPGNVEVFDITGKKVMAPVSKRQLVTSLNNGLYIVRFKDSNGKVVSGKVSLY